MVRVIVRSRAEAGVFAHTGPWVAISIRNPAEPRVRFTGANFAGSLDLAFEHKARPFKDYIIFDDDMADRVWDFTEAHKHALVLVHCTRGLYRSPAIAAALCKVWTGDDEEWFRTKTPNAHVYDCMIRAAHRRWLI